MRYPSWRLLWEELLVFFQLVDGDGAELLVELELGLGELSQVDDH